jgi:hypothetical protein
VDKVEPQTPGELPSFKHHRIRTGVIFAVPADFDMQLAVIIRDQLEERFPGVRFAVAPGTSSVAFEWDEDDS